MKVIFINSALLDVSLMAEKRKRCRDSSECNCLLCNGFMIKIRARTWTEFAVIAFSVLYACKPASNFRVTPSEIHAFGEKHWNDVWVDDREQSARWLNSYFMILSKKRKIFEGAHTGNWKLRRWNLTGLEILKEICDDELSSIDESRRTAV